MLWKAKVRISDEIYTNFNPLGYIFRCFGIYPFTMERTGLGLFIKWSPWYALYGYTLALLIICTSFSEAVIGIISKKGANLDVLSRIDNIVWLCVVITYCIASFIGVFITPNKFSQFRDYIKCLNQVDSLMRTISAKYNKRALDVMAIVLCADSVVIYILFTYTYISFIDNTKELIRTLLTVDTSITLHIWVGIMMEYMIRLMTHILTMRFSRLNAILKDQYMRIKKKEKGCYRPCLKINKELRSSTEMIATPAFNVENIIKISKTYLKLMEAARILNNLFGITILIVMASALFQLISTPYYLILSLEGKRRGVLEIILRLLKFLQQLLRVLFITEPMYECMIAAKTTGNHVCNLLSLNIERHYRKQLDAFARSIWLLQVNFSACGFFNVDRLLISTLVGTITTYVVILLQAQESDTK